MIGLEIHIQLDTQRKIFGTEGFAFGHAPNHQLSPVTISHPGALPFFNEQCLAFAIKLGLATQSHLNSPTYFARKNYFYPDSPKGYQISQAEKPICERGVLEIRHPDGTYQSVRITRIHLEEDAGKSIHDLSPQHSHIDLNRSGVGLLELVTEPELHSPEAAGSFVAEIRRLVRYLGICDGNMEQGSLRCDANVSVRKGADAPLGTRVEIKNINSISNVVKAITYERERQIDQLEKGAAIVQQTRLWNVDTGRTAPMREKETADDYRYFPEPDLLPLQFTQEDIDLHQKSLPELPLQRFKRYFVTYKLGENEAWALVEQRATSDYFESLIQLTQDPKSSGNWLLGEIKAYLNQQNIPIRDFPLKSEKIASLIELVKSGKLPHHLAKEQLFPAMLAQPEADPLSLAEEKQLLIESQAVELETAMQQIMQAFPDEVQRYQQGKKALQGFFVGQLMRQFKGKADPKEVNQVVQKSLKKSP